MIAIVDGIVEVIQNKMKAVEQEYYEKINQNKMTAVEQEFMLGLKKESKEEKPGCVV